MPRGGTRVTLPRVCKSLSRGAPQHWYDHLLAGMNRVAQRQTQLLQNGYLRFYLLIIVATTVALAVAQTIQRHRLPSMLPRSSMCAFTSGSSPV